MVLGVNGRWTDPRYLSEWELIDLTARDGINPINKFSLWDVLNDLDPNGISKMLEVIRW